MWLTRMWIGIDKVKRTPYIYEYSNKKFLIVEEVIDIALLPMKVEMHSMVPKPFLKAKSLGGKIELDSNYEILL